MTDVTQEWLGTVRALQAVVQEGLTYTKDPWDADRFGRLRDLLGELSARVLPDGRGLLPADPLPLDAERGYLTPKLDVRAAVHEAEGRLLLVREVSDGRWALPGGWADVGETLAEGVVREVREETGFAVEVERLLGIYDRERTGHPPMLHWTLKAVLRCRLVGGTATTSPETDAVDWFGPGEVPPLSVGRTSPDLVARVFAHHADPALPPDL